MLPHIVDNLLESYFCFACFRAASIAASAGGSDSKRQKLTIWPEWNDTDVNGEKWVSTLSC